jgi:hypothetical protein
LRYAGQDIRYVGRVIKHAGQDIKYVGRDTKYNICRHTNILLFAMIWRHTEIPETLRYKLKPWWYNSDFFSITAIWRVIAG